MKFKLAEISDDCIVLKVACESHSEFTVRLFVAVQCLSMLIVTSFPEQLSVSVFDILVTG